MADSKLEQRPADLAIPEDVSEKDADPSYASSPTSSLPLLQDEEAHVEKEESADKNIAAEYLVSTHIKLILLGLYFAMNLSLTLYNKAILGSVSDSIDSPWTLLILSSNFHGF